MAGYLLTCLVCSGLSHSTTPPPPLFKSLGLERQYALYLSSCVADHSLQTIKVVALCTTLSHHCSSIAYKWKLRISSLMWRALLHKQYIKCFFQLFPPILLSSLSLNIAPFFFEELLTYSIEGVSCSLTLVL